jgi:hypothetical protein
MLRTYCSWTPSAHGRWCPSAHRGVSICRLRRAHDPFSTRTNSLLSSDCKPRPAIGPRFSVEAAIWRYLRVVVSRSRLLSHELPPPLQLLGHDRLPVRRRHVFEAVRRYPTSGSTSVVVGGQFYRCFLDASEAVLEELKRYVLVALVYVLVCVLK